MIMVSIDVVSLNKPKINTMKFKFLTILALTGMVYAGCSSKSNRTSTPSSTGGDTGTTDISVKDIAVRDTAVKDTFLKGAGGRHGNTTSGKGKKTGTGTNGAGNKP